MKLFYLETLSTTIINNCKKARKRIWIASPYIGGLKSVRSILGVNSTSTLGNARLLVDSSNPENCDYRTLNYLMDIGFKIRTLTMLHAKIYILDNNCIIASANLSERAFTLRKEVGALIDKSDNSELIKIFEEYWKSGIDIKNKFTKTQIKKQRKSFKKPGEFDKNAGNVKPFFKLEVNEDIKGWLKISGFSDSKKREEPLNTTKAKNESFIGCRRFRSDGNPRLKENDIVILSRMGKRKGISDHFIWGRAKVDIPYRDKKDDMESYINRIDNKKGNRNDVIKRMKQWHKGFWIKELEIIEGSKTKYIWVSELKRDYPSLFDKLSINEQSHLKLNDEQLRSINDLFTKRVTVNRKVHNPQGCWINDYIKDKSLWVTKDKVR